ncbi:MAG: polysaccharide biosynthesis C-terminal domain-containing protein [Myxococcales bacterium]|nr:polysaccharide biosynthesis C-terminal domain-containing protein [Myxococcales bacterium]
MAAAPEAAAPRGVFGRGVLTSLAFTATMAALALANNVVISRLAGPGPRGLYALGVSLLAVALPILSLGQGPTSTFLIGRGTAPARVAGLVYGVAAALLPVGGAVALGVHLVHGGVPTTGMLAALGLAALALPAAALLEGVRGCYLGLRQVTRYNLCQAAVIALVLILNAALLPRGDAWVLWNLGLGYWIVALGVLVLARPRLAWPGRALIGRAARYGARASAVVLADAGLLRVDYLLMAAMVPVEHLGIYAIADQITHIMSWPGLLAGRMMLAESASDAGSARTLDKLGLAVRLYVAAIVGAGALAAACLWWVIPAVFGDPFAPAYLGVLILLPASLCKGVHAQIATYLEGQGAQRPVVRAGVVALAVDVALVLALVPRFGWLAAAAVRTAAYAVQLALSLAALARHAGGPRPGLVLTRADAQAVARWIAARRARSAEGAHDDAA